VAHRAPGGSEKDCPGRQENGARGLRESGPPEDRYKANPQEQSPAPSYRTSTMRPDHRHSSGRRTPPPIPARRLITAHRDSPFARSSDPAGRRQHCGVSRSRLNRLPLRLHISVGHCSSDSGRSNSAWCQRDTGADEVSNQDKARGPALPVQPTPTSDQSTPAITQPFADERRSAVSPASSWSP
jgi:hypothetical protein